MRKIGKLKLKRRNEKIKEVIQQIIFLACALVIVLTLITHCDKIKQYEETNTTYKLNTSAGASKTINDEVTPVTIEKNDSNVVASAEKELIDKLNGVSSQLEEATKEVANKSKPYKIRTTGYCDHGYMKGGKWVYDGAIAGKEEWLGRKCNLYRVNKDGSMGELIGTYTFEDTGYGINGSLVKGTSVDIWFPTEDEVWDFVHEYGDYTYIEWLD